jgi:polyhydroxyalkanoate synthesis regulator phasin
MPQPKKPAGARKPAVSAKPKPKPAAAARPVKPKAAAAAKPKPRAARAAPAPTPRPALPTSSDELVANLNALRERLVSSLTLTTDRLQDTVDDAVRRGRMTRKDAEDLLATLVTAGRAQSESLLSDVEHLLGRSTAVRATVDRARRRVRSATFPITGYDDLTAVQITKRLDGLTPAQLRRVRDHERTGDARKSVLVAIERKLT